VIDALKKSRITRADLTATQSQTLRQHSNPSISRPALELLGKVNTDRAAVIERFRPALQKHGDPKLGEKIFTERCATCHRFAGKGAAVGPDLESVRGNGREYLLTQMLDPNREVNSRYVLYQADLLDGDRISGILAHETDAEVTFRLANAEEKTVPRNQIKRLTASPQSLMPVGLEEGLGENEMASLLDYLSSSP
jgi:putative heme-binding domain-containing protein